MSCFASDALQGRVALITGGGTGIGKGIARLLGEHGARVFIASRKEDVLALASAELPADGIDCDYSRCDIRDYADVETMVQRVLSTFGKLDIVVNNAASPAGWRCVLGSSRTRRRGEEYNALAREIRCNCPPDNLKPPSPMLVI